jgi:IS4 transposase
VSRVPVVRLFGATPRGQKATIHVHRVRRLLMPLSNTTSPSLLFRFFHIVLYYMMNQLSILLHVRMIVFLSFVCWRQTN